MMRNSLAIFCLFASAAFAGVPANSITITNSTGSTVNQPYTISRFFAQGEIQNYPKPIGVAQYQSDVKTRWRDSFASFAVTAATNTTPIRITTGAAHFFQDGDYVTLSGLGGGNANANGRFLIAKVSSTGFDLVNSVGNGVYTSGGTVKGPAWGSVQHALISFWRSTPTGTPDTITFANNINPCHLGDQATCTAAGLDATGMLAFNGSAWGALLQAQAPGATLRSADARTLLTGGKFKFWLRGPIVTVAIVEDRTSARASDFGWTCASKYRVKADTETDELTTYDYATGTTPVAHGWTEGTELIMGAPSGSTGPAPLTGQIQLNRFVRSPTATTFQVSTSKTGALLDITTVGSGPVYASSCSTSDYANDTWADDTTYRSLHPEFILTFFPGWSGVYQEFVMQNGWTTALQDQRYTVTLKNGASNAHTVISKLTTQYARTEWVYRAWDGTATTLEFPTSAQIFTASLAPPNFTIDLNKQYIIYSKMVPQFDPRLTVNTANTVAVTDIPTYQSRVTGNEPFVCTGAGTSSQYCLNWLMNLADTGGRGDIGWIPRWYARYLYTFDKKFFWAMLGNADMAGAPPYHMWESASGKWYDRAHTVDAFGLPLSISARPSILAYTIGNSLDNTAIASGDKLTFVDPFPSTPAGFSLSSNHHWVAEYNQSDPAHNPGWHYLPYMTTGDYFYLQDGLAFTSQYLAADSGTQRGGSSNNSSSDWGIQNMGQMRGRAWASRSIYNMAVMAPDGTPEKGYYMDKANANIAGAEASFNIPDGHYARTCDPNTFNKSTETSYYCWSYLAKGDALGPDGNMLSLPYLRSPNTGNTNDMNEPPTTTVHGTFQGYLWAMVQGTAAEVGFKTDRILSKIPHWWIELINSPNPRDLEQYVIPVNAFRPASALASNITSTALTIPLAAAPTWNMTPPYALKLYNLSATGSQLTIEWVLICGQSGSTLTVCTGGRGALNPAGLGNSHAAAAHNGDGNLAANGVTTSTNAEPADLSPMFNAIPPFKASQPVAFTNWTTPFLKFDDLEFGWSNLAVDALSYAEKSWSGGKSGYDAYTALLAYRAASGYNYNGNGSDQYAQNPKLQQIIRRDPVLNVQVTAGDTFAIIRYRAPSAGVGDSACTVDGVSDGQSGVRDRMYVRTGLTDSTAYTSTIHCNADYYNNGAGVGNTAVSFTTAAATSGATTFALTVGPGGTTAYLDYGSTSSLGTTVSTGCSTGCTLTSGSVTRGLVYYRVRRDTGAAGPVRPMFVR